MIEFPRGEPTFQDIVAAVHHESGPIDPVHVGLAMFGYERMKHTRDLSHGQEHLDGIGQSLLYHMSIRPTLVGEVHLGRLVALAGIHDLGVSALSGLVGLAVGQTAERLVAERTGVHFMSMYGVPPEEKRVIGKLVSIHPLGLYSRARHRLERQFNSQTRMTSRLFCLHDSLDVLNPKRIPMMIGQVSRAFGGVSVVPLYNVLARYFIEGTKFVHDIPGEFPEMRLYAVDRWRRALALVRHIRDTKADIRESLQSNGGL